MRLTKEQLEVLIENAIKEAKKKKEKKPHEKVRKPVAPPSKKHKDPTQYDRKKDKRVDIDEQRQDHDRAFRGAGLPSGAGQFDEVEQTAQVAELVAEEMVRFLAKRLGTLKKKMSPQHEQMAMEAIYKVLMRVFQ